jgi:hypothetical protein
VKYKSISQSNTQRIFDMSDMKIHAKDIHAKWGKLTEADVATVKSHGALSALIAKAYSLDKAKADADVTAWQAGRNF